MSERFVHLHLHSEFSLADSTLRIKPLIAKAKELAMPALAITDLQNFYGAVKFYRTAMAAGIKPIIGADVTVIHPDAPCVAQRVVLLCMDNEGYRGLNRLLTTAFLDQDKHGGVVIDWLSLSTNHRGLIAIIDGQEGFTVQDFDSDAQRDGILADYLALFPGRLYFEVCRIGAAAENSRLQRIVNLAVDNAVPLVASNRVQFLNESDFASHEIRTCIHDGRVLDDPRRVQKFTAQQYFRSAAEMQELFADFPEAISNTFEIAKRCNLFLDFSQDFLPDYPGLKERSVDEELREQSQRGLADRLNVASLFDETGAANVAEEYVKRLDMELDVIVQMGFPGYFLIVADFIAWSRNNDIPVGPGRGSGAGSIVAWALGITELDPLPFGLLFERFLNPERVSMPDFDIDFCVDGRDRVIEYVANRYGQDQVAQIITFGTLAAKAVLRDVGRVLGMPYGFVDQIAKLVPFEVGMTLTKALEQEDQLRERYEQDEEIKKLIDNGLRLEGLARNVGKHAGGVVIAPKALTEYTPLYADSHLQQAVTQYDKDDLEAVGLVKFDFLGLRTLTIIHHALKLVYEATGEKINIDTIVTDDAKTFDLIQQGKTTAIFQLESSGMKDLIVRLVPDKFEDLVALVALFRPGPLQSGMVDDFIDRKHGREEIEYPHPALENVLDTTYGVILYQEQVMQIAQILAAYSLGGADLLRRAMGKKKPEEMAKQRVLFLQGAETNNIDSGVAEYIFDLMEKFAGYGFNKSHSAAYALVSYQTAWLKTHHCAAFMAATMSADMDNTEKVVFLIADCNDLGIKVSPPNINQCQYHFQPIDDTTILYGIGAVKGVGRGIIETIVAEREDNGPFTDLFDICARIDIKKMNKRVLEALIKAGALDQLDGNRAALFASIGDAMRAASQQQKDQEIGQFDLFGSAAPVAQTLTTKTVVPWEKDLQLSYEKETLGLYLTGHPYDRYRQELNAVCQAKLDSIDLSKPQRVLFSGLIIGMRVLNTKRGKMAFVNLDNGEYRVEISLFSEKYQQFMPLLQKDTVIIAHGDLSIDERSGGFQMRAFHLYGVDEFRELCMTKLQLTLQQHELNSGTLSTLQQCLAPQRGGGVRIIVRYHRLSGDQGYLELPETWAVKPSEAVFDELRQLFGPDSLLTRYNVAPLQNNAPAQNRFRWQKGKKKAGNA